MALSNRYTTPLSLVKPADPAEEENDNATIFEDESTSEYLPAPVSEQVTRPFKALVPVPPQPDPAYQPDPADLNPALFAVDDEADTRPNFPAIAAPDPMLPAIPPAETPLYLRNPGPPPKLPHNRNVKSLGRTSYRFQQVQFGYNNHRTLLYICAVIGIILLFVLIVIRPQDRKVVNNAPVAVAATAGPIATSTSEPTATQKPAISIVPDDAQFAVVTDVEGFVLEEPREGAAQVQNLSQFTYIAFQRKSQDGWYQLKGGAGWIKASSVKVFATEKAAWDFKNSEEAKIKG